MLDMNPGSSAIRLLGRAERAPQRDGLPVAVEFTLHVPERTPVAGAVDRALNVGIAVDRSGSMGGPKLAAAQEAVIGVAHGLKDGERLAVAAFDNSVSTVSESVRLDARARAQLEKAIRALGVGGNTALFDGFVRTAELVAEGADAAQAESWTVVLSDGMGNAGLTNPAEMHRHARALAERGIRTIAIGIGSDYQAAQLTALANGGLGEFHHASAPAEIVEIVLAELNEVRAHAATEVRVELRVAGAGRWQLLGGIVDRQDERGGSTRFDRLYPGRSARVIALLWPEGPAVDRVQVEGRADWRDADGNPGSAATGVDVLAAPTQRDVEIASRAAGLWHASLVAAAVECNERGDFDGAARLLDTQVREFARYVEGLPGLEASLASLREVVERAAHRWEGLSRKEVYVMALKGMKGRPDLRPSAPVSYSAALEVDEPKRKK